MPRMPALPAQQRQPSRGPVNGLHMAARNGSIDHIVSLLSGGAIDIDQGSPRGFTPLMYAAQEGRSQVARVLISRGANVTLSADGGVTALHFCSEKGHAMVTNDLVHAGADVEARRHDRGPTPLFLAAQSGHLGVMKVLIKAGANVDCRLTDGTSALAQAASFGHLDTVRELIRGNANPTLTRSGSWGFGVLPLDAAATKGHSEVVRELINRFGIRGCGGASGGNTALAGAAMEQHIETMVILVSAGVVDDFPALYQAAARGREASVKLLLLAGIRQPTRQSGR